MFLATISFPAIVVAIPLFAAFTRLHLRGSLAGLVLVYVAQTVPVGIYMLRNYFETVPQTVEEAGMVDGLGHGGAWRISIPLAMPSIIATGLFIFMIAGTSFCSRSYSWSTIERTGPSPWACRSSRAASRFPRRC